MVALGPLDLKELMGVREPQDLKDLKAQLEPLGPLDLRDHKDQVARPALPSVFLDPPDRMEATTTVVLLAHHVVPLAA